MSPCEQLPTSSQAANMSPNPRGHAHVCLIVPMARECSQGREDKGHKNQEGRLVTD